MNIFEHGDFYMCPKCHKITKGEVGKLFFCRYCGHERSGLNEFLSGVVIAYDVLADRLMCIFSILVVLWVLSK